MRRKTPASEDAGCSNYRCYDASQEMHDFATHHRNDREFQAVFMALAPNALAQTAKAHMALLRDITTVEGRENPLLGYGLVVGLNGTGDRQQTIFSIQTPRNILQRMGRPSCDAAKHAGAQHRRRLRHRNPAALRSARHAHGRDRLLDRRRPAA